MKPSDYELIHQIKIKVQQLPDLQIPPPDSYIILEADGCMEGWGGICKWKKKKNDPITTEKICAYASGRFKTVQTTIDAEIHACINALEKLKIYYLDQKEMTLRTDCQAIISFYNKTNSNKASRVRWMKFADAMTGTGVKVNIEHIEGKQNVLADALSRLINLCLEERVQNQQDKLGSITVTAQEILTNGSNQEKERLADLCNTSLLLLKPRSKQTQTKAQMKEPMYGAQWLENQQKKEGTQQDGEMIYPLAQRFVEESPMNLNPREMAQMNLAQFREAHEKERDCKTQWYNDEAHRNDGKWEWYGTRFGTYATRIRAHEMEAHKQEAQDQGKEVLAQAKRSMVKPKGSLDQKMTGLAINCMIEEYNDKMTYVRDDDSREDNEEIIVDPGWDDWGIKAIEQNRVDVCGGARYCRL